MKYLLQSPLPDELLWSALNRSCRRFGLSVWIVLRLLNRRPCTCPTFFQASRIVGLDWPTSLSLSDLLFQHTPFPYITAFYSRDGVDTALHAALSEGRNTAKFERATRTMSHFVPYRRFCTECVLADRRRFGTAYWHRSHNIPGVVFCQIHDRILHESTVKTTGKADWNYEAPGEGPNAPLSLAGISPFDRDLARRSIEFLQTNPMERVRTADRQYRRHLEQVGILTTGKRIDPKKLVAWFSSVVDAHLHDYVFDPRKKSVCWLIQLTSSGKSSPSSAPYHAILGTAIAMSNHRNISPVDRVQDRTKLQKRWQSLDKKFTLGLASVSDRFDREGQQASIYQAMQEVGCWTSYRNNPSRLPSLLKEVERYRQVQTAIRDRNEQARDAQYARLLARLQSQCIRQKSWLSLKSALSEIGYGTTYVHSPNKYPLLVAQIRLFQRSEASIQSRVVVDNAGVIRNARSRRAIDGAYSANLSLLISKCLQERSQITVRDALATVGCKRFYSRPALYPKVAAQIRRLRHSKASAQQIWPRLPDRSVPAQGPINAATFGNRVHDLSPKNTSREVPALNVEARRRKGMRLLAQGVAKAQVARLCGVCAQTAANWSARAAHGKQSWRQRPNNLPFFDKQRRAKLDELLTRGTRANGHQADRWTLALISELIEQNFGRRFTITTVWRLLHEIGLRAEDGWKKAGG